MFSPPKVKSWSGKKQGVLPFARGELQPQQKRNI